MFVFFPIVDSPVAFGVLIYKWGSWFLSLTLTMLRLLSSKAQGRKDLWDPSKPCHVGIHWKALPQYSQMNTHLPGFRWFFRGLHHFVLTKLVDGSIRVKISLKWRWNVYKVEISIYYEWYKLHGSAMPFFDCMVNNDDLSSIYFTQVGNFADKT